MVGTLALCPPYATRLPEVIVHADLEGVKVEGAGIKRNSAEIVGLAAEAAVHVFALGRPARSKHVFEATADGEARVRLGLGKRGKASDRERGFVVGPGITALGIEQRRIDREAGAAGHAAERVDLGIQRGHGAGAVILGDPVPDAGAGSVYFDTEDE